MINCRQPGAKVAPAGALYRRGDEGEMVENNFCEPTRFYHRLSHIERLEIVFSCFIINFFVLSLVALLDEHRALISNYLVRNLAELNVLA